jgi:predicted HAD superfamily phosphohydrolase YqeG
MNMSPLVIYIDVDDTLVRTFGNKRIPRKEVVNHVKQLKAEGAILYCWSTGGATYARESAIELGIEYCFEGFLPKPEIYIDDMELHEWRSCRWINPSNCSNTSCEEYRRLIFAQR